LASNGVREGLIFVHPFQIEGLHTFELVVGLAGERVSGRS
jgi:hypothetical protein